MYTTLPLLFLYPSPYKVPALRINRTIGVVYRVSTYIPSTSYLQFFGPTLNVTVSLLYSSGRYCGCSLVVVEIPTSRSKEEWFKVKLEPDN